MACKFLIFSASLIFQPILWLQKYTLSIKTANKILTFQYDWCGPRVLSLLPFPIVGTRRNAVYLRVR